MVYELLKGNVIFILTSSVSNMVPKTQETFNKCCWKEEDEWVKSEWMTEGMNEVNILSKNTQL